MSFINENYFWFLHNSITNKQDLLLANNKPEIYIMFNLAYSEGSQKFVFSIDLQIIMKIIESAPMITNK
jgi:hypothetical protein